MWARFGFKCLIVFINPTVNDLSQRIAEALLAEYAGRYSGGDDLVYVIQWDGKQLTCGRPRRPPRALKVEVRDGLFIPGQPPVRKIFLRDKEGKITGFVDRREGEDLVWHREAKTGS